MGFFTTHGSPLLAPWMSRSTGGGVLPSLRRGCRDRERRGEPPPHAVDVENKERRGEFSPPRAVDVEIERGGIPLLAPRMSKTRDDEGTHPSSHRCQLQLLPSLRRRRQLGGM